MADAVELLHNSCKLAHLDIKPDNFVIGEGKLHLIDFGHAKPAKVRTIADSGTDQYLAPEVRINFFTKGKSGGYLPD